MVSYKSVLSVVYILGLFFQNSSCSPLDLDSKSINDSKLYHRAPVAVSNKLATPATTTEKICIAPSNRGPKPKLKVWPAVEKSSSKTVEAPQSGYKGKVQERSFKNTEAHQLDRRIPFPGGLPEVENNPNANYDRMYTIIMDPQTTNIFADGGYSNSFVLETNTDQQIATKTGALQGCTILFSHNQARLYFSYHWEYPGFNKDKTTYPKIEFDKEVKGFLLGEEGSYGEGLPLVAPGISKKKQPMYKASTSIITVGHSSGGGTSRANYGTKIQTIADITTSKLDGTSRIFPYKRPFVGDPDGVRVTIEYCAANRHLRVMISDTRTGQTGGHRVIDQTI